MANENKINEAEREKFLKILEEKTNDDLTKEQRAAKLAANPNLAANLQRGLERLQRAQEQESEDK